MMLVWSETVDHTDESRRDAAMWYETIMMHEGKEIRLSQGNDLAQEVDFARRMADGSEPGKFFIRYQHNGKRVGSAAIDNALRARQEREARDIRMAIASQTR
jgi:hypothetical protein